MISMAIYGFKDYFKILCISRKATDTKKSKVPSENWLDNFILIDIHMTRRPSQNSKKSMKLMKFSLIRIKKGI